MIIAKGSLKYHHILVFLWVFPSLSVLPVQRSMDSSPKSVMVSFMVPIQQHCNVFFSLLILPMYFIFNLLSLA